MLIYLREEGGERVGVGGESRGGGGETPERGHVMQVPRLAHCVCVGSQPLDAQG